MLDTDATTNPARPWKKWLLIFGVWTLIALLNFSQLYFGPLGKERPVVWYKELGVEFLCWYVMAFGTPVIFWLGDRFPMERPRRLVGLAFHLLASIIFVFVYTAVLVFVIQLDPVKPPWFEPSASFFAKYLKAFSRAFSSYFFIYWAILGVGHAINYYRQFREREQKAAAWELRASQLEAQLAHAQLQALKMQLHPHFLFNALHSIAALVREDDKKAAIRMIVGLSDLLRLALENVGVQEVSLRQELEFLEKYLEIEQIRFQDRLAVRMAIEPETLDAQVPYLILQPLVENAIRHGIAQRAAASLVEIKTWRQDGELCLQVRDDGPGLPRDWSSTRGEGVGIKTTRARLQQLYGSRQGFSLQIADRCGVVAIITIPFSVKKSTPGDEFSSPELDATQAVFG